jgi:hypothetical protein
MLQNGAEMMVLLSRREVKHSGNGEQDRKLTDDDKGGSGSGTGGSASTGAEGAKNKAAKMSMDQAYAEIERLKQENDRKDPLIADLTKQLDEANKVLESQEKGRLISEILPRSQFRMDELVGKSVEDLKNIRATLELAMPPKVNSVRFGVQGGDLSDREKGLTVGDLSFATAQKRKAGAA